VRDREVARDHDEAAVAATGLGRGGVVLAVGRFGRVGVPATPYLAAVAPGGARTIAVDEAVRWQTVLGDESLVQKLRDRVKGLHKQRREITSLRGVVPSVDPQKILQRVAKKYGVDRQRLVAPGEKGLQAKNVAMWMVWETGSKSLREIGELFGGLDYAAVAQRIRRTKSTYNPIAARRMITAMLNV